jgi:hypothetical protein
VGARRQERRRHPPRDGPGRRADDRRAPGHDQVGALGVRAIRGDRCSSTTARCGCSGAGGGSTACDLLGLDPKHSEGLDFEVGLIVAFDAIGGFYAIDGRGLGGGPAEDQFLAPDTLECEPTGDQHGQWVEWAFNADLDEFYKDLRWPGWEDEVEALAPDQGLSLYPPP